MERLRLKWNRVNSLSDILYISDNLNEYAIPKLDEQFLSTLDDFLVKLEEGNKIQLVALRFVVSVIERAIAVNSYDAGDWAKMSTKMTSLIHRILKKLISHPAFITSEYYGNIIEKISDTFLGAGDKMAGLKGLLVRNCGALILQIVSLEDLTFTVRKSLLVRFKQVIKGIQPVHRRALLYERPQLTSELIAMLPSCGDWDFQECLVATLLRFSMTYQDWKATLATWSSEFPLIVEAIALLDVKRYEVTTRKFLNLVNSHQPLPSRVFSLPSLRASAGNMQLQKPSDYEEIWVDCSPRSGNIQLMVDGGCGGWTRIVLEYSFIKSIKISRERISTAEEPVDNCRMNFILQSRILVPLEREEKVITELNVVFRMNKQFREAETHFFQVIYGHAYQPCEALFEGATKNLISSKAREGSGVRAEAANSKQCIVASTPLRASCHGTIPVEPNRNVPQVDPQRSRQVTSGAKAEKLIPRLRSSRSDQITYELDVAEGSGDPRKSITYENAPDNCASGKTSRQSTSFENSWIRGISCHPPGPEPSNEISVVTTNVNSCNSDRSQNVHVEPGAKSQENPPKKPPDQPSTTTINSKASNARADAHQEDLSKIPTETQPPETTSQSVGFAHELFTVSSQLNLRGDREITDFKELGRPLASANKFIIEVPSVNGNNKFFSKYRPSADKSPESEKSHSSCSTIFSRKKFGETVLIRKASLNLSKKQMLSNSPDPYAFHDKSKTSDEGEATKKRLHSHTRSNKSSTSNNKTGNKIRKLFVPGRDGNLDIMTTAEPSQKAYPQYFMNNKGNRVSKSSKKVSVKKRGPSMKPQAKEPRRSLRILKKVCYKETTNSDSHVESDYSFWQPPSSRLVDPIRSAKPPVSPPSPQSEVRIAAPTVEQLEIPPDDVHCFPSANEVEFVSVRLSPPPPVPHLLSEPWTKLSSQKVIPPPSRQTTDEDLAFVDVESVASPQPQLGAPALCPEPSTNDNCEHRLNPNGTDIHQSLQEKIDAASNLICDQLKCYIIGMKKEECSPLMQSMKVNLETALESHKSIVNIIREESLNIASSATKIHDLCDKYLTHSDVFEKMIAIIEDEHREPMVAASVRNNDPRTFSQLRRIINSLLNEMVCVNQSASTSSH